MVVPPQRDGGQSQYIDAPVAECKSDSFALVAEWMLDELEKSAFTGRAPLLTVTGAA